MWAATLCSLFTSLLLGTWSSVPTKLTLLQQPEVDQPDLLVVGAGISGLSSALEAAQKGAQVTVVDLWSVFGGHAVVAGGVLSIVDTPFQVSEGIQDSPELAHHDFTVWGEDADPGWVRLYVDRSRSLIYDWVTTMGVEFGSLTRPPGNSVPRVHRTRGEGLALVSAIYRECLKWPNVTFIWNHKVTGLVKAQGRVVGVQAINVRSQEELVLRASAVVLATGGFQTNLKMVRQFWPDHLQFPERLLVSSGFNALGSGHALAQEAGGTIQDMDHQWNYSTGIPDPRHPGTNRGFFAKSPAAIWVNVQGERFVNESGSTKMTFPAVVNQESSRFWAVFDEAGRKKLEIRGTASDDPEEMILQLSPDLIKRADSIEQLAVATGLDVMTLQSTVNRFNRFVEKGEDEDFQRFERTRTPLRENPAQALHSTKNREASLLCPTDLSRDPQKHGRRAHRSILPGSGPSGRSHTRTVRGGRTHGVRRRQRKGGTGRYISGSFHCDGTGGSSDCSAGTSDPDILIPSRQLLRQPRPCRARSGSGQPGLLEMSSPA